MKIRDRFRKFLLQEGNVKMPIVTTIGFWDELINKWYREGHISKEHYDEILELQKNTPFGNVLSKKPYKKLLQMLGFDDDVFKPVWPTREGLISLLTPQFETEVIKTLPDGSMHVRLLDGEIVLVKANESGQMVPGILPLVRATLVDRASWEEHYLPRLTYAEDKIDHALLKEYETMEDTREDILMLYCGSMVGVIRNWLGLENFSYLQYDDPDLLVEIVNTFADYTDKIIEGVLKYNIQYDWGYIWEDMAFKNGPLINPALFHELTAANYKRRSKLLDAHGFKIRGVDCDGLSISLADTWIENGINTVFPIEHGTWGGNFGQFRKKYGDKVMGIGGVRKACLSEDKSAVDAEIERLKPLVDLGGYLPCPDHQMTPDAKWELVQYYTDQMRKAFN